LPEATYRKLVERARKERRSLSQQAMVLLERALDASTEPRERRRLLLKELAARPLTQDPKAWPSPEQTIREDRER
jgi:hypothetical protein